MRLKYVYIEKYRNLTEIKVNFEADNLVEVFVGCNGSGKSNFIEAILKIFRHVYSIKDKEMDVYNEFDYEICYEISGKEINIRFQSTKIYVDGIKVSDLNRVPLPNRILIYYSGHNDRVGTFINEYNSYFCSKIKKADVEKSRRFIGANDSYKELLLTTLLLQPEQNKTRMFLLDKLDVNLIGKEFLLELKRPSYAINQYGKRKQNFDIDGNDDKGRYWWPEGNAKAFLDELSTCITKAQGEVVRAEGYLWNEDVYKLYIDVEKFREKFSDLDSEAVFTNFDNLKALGMLDSIKLPLKLKNGRESNIFELSDGQLQSVYIYAISELFDGSNCLTLMDEPDSFLHPDWQYNFLKQIDLVSNSANRTNHILISSHSAVTLIPHQSKLINYFELVKGKPKCITIPKHIAVQKLSSKLISYSEHEQLLGVIQTIQVENKPILFTEGNSDPLIINEAWRKLYQEEMPFIPYYAFTCTYINQLITDKRIHNEMNGKPVFGLYDFDDAYNHWNGMNGDVQQNIPGRGLIKKWKEGNSYAIMLPIPDNPIIRSLVIKNEQENLTYEGNSTCAIEHLFYGNESTMKFFTETVGKGNGKDIKFTADKENFAKNIVPLLAPHHFEVFRPMFEFIKLKCIE
ncbi:AAA family ATPase [Vibrio crassostreae]|nr:AAA family ATPase [Vibrio crassostreae]CAK3487443.1 AAA family ATPase [Vibrio crassostreae]CAK3507379.1 AAA family ATPase [Vibrio crassostreae]CAK3544077.1 AAA family ATPase [Vibrio crassostreae]CAK3552962.1 AAA family ATPase [Vibrio crassostreae]